MATTYLKIEADRLKRFIGKVEHGAIPALALDNSPTVVKVLLGQRLESNDLTRALVYVIEQGVLASRDDKEAIAFFDDLLQRY